MRLKSSPIGRLGTQWLSIMVSVIAIGAGGHGLRADPSANSPDKVSEHASNSVVKDDSSLSTAERGAYLYEAYCKSCHGDKNGRGRTAGASPHNEKGHTWHHPDAQLIDWVLNGKFGARAMPKFKGDLAENDVRAILHFIKEWWTPEQRKIQENVSRRYRKGLDRNQPENDR